MKKFCVVLVIAVVCFSFSSVIFPGSINEPVPVPPSKQRTGDPRAGYEYLITGDYLRSGIPLSYFKMGFGKPSVNYLHRDGINADIPYDYTVVNAPNGEQVVAPNCMQCHAQVFEGRLIMGLGNSSIDFSKNQKLDPRNAE